MYNKINAISFYLVYVIKVIQTINLSHSYFLYAIVYALKLFKKPFTQVSKQYLYAFFWIYLLIDCLQAT